MQPVVRISHYRRNEYGYVGKRICRRLRWKFKLSARKRILAREYKFYFILISKLFKSIINLIILSLIKGLEVQMLKSDWNWLKINFSRRFVNKMALQWWQKVIKTLAVTSCIKNLTHVEIIPCVPEKKNFTIMTENIPKKNIYASIL